MIAAAAFLALLLAQQEEGVKFKSTTFARNGDKVPSIMLQFRQEPLDPARKSPKKFGLEKQPWEFPWITSGYGYYPAVEKYLLRFRVYSQDHNEDREASIVRMLMTMQQEAVKRIRFDHADRYNGGIVDVFLCWGGKAGGEQRFDVTIEKGEQKNVNTIYFYDLPSFKEPLEMAREIAHEYGHASLPAVGGYKEPEGWANGYLGEKLYLKWLRDGIAAGTLSSNDVIGVSLADLDQWLATNVDPLVLTAAESFPIEAALKNPSKAGMDRYLGLAMYAATVLPDSVFGRSLLLTGSIEAKDYPEALTLAAEEPDTYTIRIPKALAGHAIWLPTGKGKISGAKIIQFRGKWVQLQAPEGTITVVNRQ
jgi:hypothetical protein